jgi:hypothetical protein
VIRQRFATVGLFAAIVLRSGGIIAPEPQGFAMRAPKHQRLFF